MSASIVIIGTVILGAILLRLMMNQRKTTGWLRIPLKNGGDMERLKYFAEKKTLFFLWFLVYLIFYSPIFFFFFFREDILSLGILCSLKPIPSPTDFSTFCVVVIVVMVVLVSRSLTRIAKLSILS